MSNSCKLRLHLLCFQLTFLINLNFVQETIYSCNLFPEVSAIEAAVAYFQLAMIFQDAEIATAHLTCSIIFDPTYASAYYERGLIYLDHQNNAQAVSDATKAIEFGYMPLDFAYALRAYAYLNLQLYDKALDDYDSAIAINQNQQFEAIYYSSKGEVYLARGNYRSAVSNYNMAIHFDPDYMPSYFGRGTGFYELGEYEAALEDYNKLIYADTSDLLDRSEFYTARGLVYEKLGHYEQSLNDHNSALKLNPNNARAYRNRAWLYEKQGLYALAIEDQTEAIALGWDEEQAYVLRGVNYFELGYYRQAEADFIQALEINPSFAEAYRMLGNVYYLQGLDAQALEHYQLYLILVVGDIDPVVQKRVDELKGHI